MVNFLDYEKLAKGQVFYNHDQVVDFSYILKNKISLYKRLAENKGITVTSSIEDKIFIKADPSALDRVVNNIIDNAIKYTEQEGKITVSLRKQINIHYKTTIGTRPRRDRVIFYVKDTGVGISKEQQKLIFNPYYQISHKKRNIQGIGMGLNIVKRIIQEINSEIRIESKPDKGTTFTIIFNRYIATHNEDIQRNLHADETAYYATKTKLKKTEIIQGRPNIFIVEDNIDMLSYLQDSLNDTYNVFSATNGIDALHKIDHIPLPNIIISDIMMDAMDGYEFYEELKVKVEYSFVPFIFLTALTSRDDRIKGIKKGAVDFISKPFNLQELKAKIESLIRLQESRKIRSELEVEERILNAIRNRKLMDKVIYSFEEKCTNFGITEREKDIIRMLLKGLEDKEVSSGLHVSYHTVRTHIKNIYKKCRIQNKIELVNLFKTV